MNVAAPFQEIMGIKWYHMTADEKCNQIAHSHFFIWSKQSIYNHEHVLSIVAFDDKLGNSFLFFSICIPEWTPGT